VYRGQYVEAAPKFKEVLRELLIIFILPGILHGQLGSNPHFRRERMDGMDGALQLLEMFAVRRTSEVLAFDPQVNNSVGPS